VRRLIGAWVHDLTMHAPAFELPEVHAYIRGRETEEGALDGNARVGSLPPAARAGDVELTFYPAP
jgi:hypothetical protein